jgi:hypothetical protein
MAGDRIVVDERFCGPPGAGNGGYVAGLVAERLGARADVTLRRPTPLATPLRLRPASSGWRLETEAEGELLVEGQPAAPVLPRVQPPPAPRYEHALHASECMPEHPFPHCFVCGPARAEGDGLRIFAAPLGQGAGVVAATWIPDASLCTDSARVDSPFLWSALDCPGAMVAMAERPRPMLLARMTAELPSRVQSGERCVVVGWKIARDGRKHISGTALYGEDGRLCGVSSQLWIEPRSAA